jgi:hypothetical protein
VWEISFIMPDKSFISNAIKNSGEQNPRVMVHFYKPSTWETEAKAS